MDGRLATPSGSVTLNGSPVSLVGLPAHTSALDLVRGQGLTGAKEGCAEGECGACAVLLARPGISTPTMWTALNACLIPALALDGQEVITVEGLTPRSGLHPVQRELAERGGTQCGYCTPGFVCSMAAEYYRPGGVPAPGGPSSDPQRPEDPAAGTGFDLDALGGNLCRCTGYRPIRDAALALGRPDPADPLAARMRLPPPGPATPEAPDGAGIVRPADLASAVAILSEHPEAVAIAGCTDWGVEVNLRGARAPLLVAVDRLPELRTVCVEDTGITVGAALTMTELEHHLAEHLPLLTQMLPRFASRLVRNAATLGGNLATASPIGDCAPVLLALGAELVLASREGQRTVSMDDFFTGYRRSTLRPGELIVAARVPRPLAATTSFEKVTKRRDDDISSVAVALAVDLDADRVRGVRIGLGGVAATPVRAHATERALQGRTWDSETVAAAAAVLTAEGTPIDDHRASAAYRRAMLGQALRRLYVRTAAVGAER